MCRRHIGVSLVLLVAMPGALGCKEDPRAPAPSATRAPAPLPRPSLGPEAEHPYIAAYRQTLVLELSLDETHAVAAVDTARTETADTTRLAQVATDRLIRGLVPLAVESAGFDSAAGRLRELPSIDDAATAGAAAEAVDEVADIFRAARADRGPEEAPFVLGKTITLLGEVGGLVAPLRDDAGFPAEAATEHGRALGRALVMLLDLFPEGGGRSALVVASSRLLAELTEAARAGASVPSPDDG